MVRYVNVIFCALCCGVRKALTVRWIRIAGREQEGGCKGEGVPPCPRQRRGSRVSEQALKTYKYLFEQVCAFDNLWHAFHQGAAHLPGPDRPVHAEGHPS
jgi:hypothetical protein